MWVTHKRQTSILFIERNLFAFLRHVTLEQPFAIAHARFFSSLNCQRNNNVSTSTKYSSRRKVSESKWNQLNNFNSILNMFKDQETSAAAMVPFTQQLENCDVDVISIIPLVALFLSNVSKNLCCCFFHFRTRQCKGNCKAKSRR